MTTRLRATLARVCDPWIARLARPEPAALAMVAGLTPAVVVCGGSRGIGLALAAEFLRDGRTVVLVARGEAGLEMAKQDLMTEAGKAGTEPKTLVLALDLTSPDAFDRLAAELSRLGLYLDVLVLSAGTGLSGPFTSHSAADIDNLLALNVLATTTFLRAALPAMLARARGGILVVSSLGGFIPGPNQAAYYASRAYVCSLTEAIGSEVSGSGVRVAVLAPGPVNTSFHAAMGADHSLYRYLMPGLSPERAASAAVWGFSLGRRVIVPGLLPKAFAVAVSVLPHWFTLPIVRLLLATPARDD